MDKTTDTLILEIAIRKLKSHINDLVGACLDEKGNPRVPSKKEIVEARKCLTKEFSHTLIKEN